MQVEASVSTLEARVRFLKDPVSALTHFMGFLAAVVGLVFLVVLSSGAPKVAGMAIYGGSLVTLFFASSVYHFFDLGERGNRKLQLFDHSAIFLLIGGTYVPALIHLLDGAWRISMLSVVGGLALGGVIMKLVWPKCPELLSTLIYLALGWLLVIPGHLILPQLDAVTLAWLVAGGLAYTIGAVVFIKEWPDPWPKRFGHHEVWHLFVLAGAGAHFVFVWRLLDWPYPPF